MLSENIVFFFVRCLEICKVSHNCSEYVIEIGWAIIDQCNKMPINRIFIPRICGFPGITVTSVGKFMSVNVYMLEYPLGEVALEFYVNTEGDKDGDQLASDWELNAAMDALLENSYSLDSTTSEAIKISEDLDLFNLSYIAVSLNHCRNFLLPTPPYAHET